ncbi:aminoglycoside phosphotransferase family protein [Marinobacter sp. X15-166B]|uniref:aminoglycoside phosphotransferase family protein n=1 Tax=Marinobacter sp. X15-166B TaxID=1897620 RepID=UPI00085BCFE0|nr:phosphotransferase [Marinobacter sp. X15-166B]OEY65717.1 aminoglycoside phosphotransferase [Marinobacter sp. X15-166B]
MDIRLKSATQWVRQFSGLERADLVPVFGDASFRRYFRIHADTGDLILMDAPPDKETCQPFVALARHWREEGIRVPDVLQQDLSQGFLLLEDFGDQLMLRQLHPESANALYRLAIDELLRIQQVSDTPSHPLPPYDAALLNREMALFPDWLVTRQLGLTLSTTEHALLDTTFAFLRESALAQPQVPVHRDYHSRNLLVLAEAEAPALGVIDFQDAVLGPVTYDLVSLLKDCYISWPEPRLAAWLEHYRALSQNAGLHRADADTFRLWFELMGMQRHLKAAGIFARLAIRDGKTGYLQDIPRTVGYLLEASARQAALRSFHHWLQERVMPAIDQRMPTP